MENNPLRNAAHGRRGFLGRLVTGAAALSMAGLASPLALSARNTINNAQADGDDWFNKIKGKHRMIFDATGPKDVLPFAWPRVFLLTNAGTGSPEKDCGVVVVLRHDAIPFALEDRLWEKYKFGEVFKVQDPLTKAPAVRNPFWKPKTGDFKVPGIGVVAIGINELQDSGVMFCACDVALTVYSAVLAGGSNADPM